MMNCFKNKKVKKQKRERERGFTLIELLVVISIIGLLSSVVLASLNGARMKARDAKRLFDLHQIRLALEQYYDDHGTYPNTSYWMRSSDASWGTLQDALALYLPNLPKDPVNNATFPKGPWNDNYYGYAYGFVPSYAGYYIKEYDLVAQLEDKNNNNRCEKRKWILNFWKYMGTIPDVWCDGGYSQYIVADH